MSSLSYSVSTVAVVALAATAISLSVVMPATGAGDFASEFPIPSSIRAEHHEIHGELVAATSLKAGTGEAARNLARVLDPHFRREEEIALRPLGLLVPLSRGEFEQRMTEILPMTDSLRAEMPRMLAEHTEIRAAVTALERAARAENNKRALTLVENLKAHALTEEEVLYPAALVVGDMIRARASRQ